MTYIINNITYDYLNFLINNNMINDYFIYYIYTQDALHYNNELYNILSNYNVIYKDIYLKYFKIFVSVKSKNLNDYFKDCFNCLINKLYNYPNIYDYLNIDFELSIDTKKLIYNYIKDKAYVYIFKNTNKDTYNKYYDDFKIYLYNTI